MKGSSSLFENYSGHSSFSLNGNSQSFKEEYSVYSKMLKKDIKNGIYDSSNNGYQINPTSKSLDKIISGEYILNKGFTASLPYVIDLDGNIIIGKRNGNGRFGPQTPHPTLIGGKNPKVKMAGMLHIKNGKIDSYDDRSGHYRPNIESMKYADEAFKKYNKYKGEK